MERVRSSYHPPTDAALKSDGNISTENNLAIIRVEPVTEGNKITDNGPSIYKTGIQLKEDEIFSPDSADYLVEVKSRFRCGWRKNRIYEVLTKILSWVCIILVISLVVLTVLDRLNHPADEYCNTDKCVRSSALIKLSMDLNVDPCENFFQYTCGRWSKEHPLSPLFRYYSKFSTISERISAAELKFLTSTDKKEDVDPVKQARKFYKSCLDRESRDTLGFETIYEYLEIVGLPKIPTFFSSNSKDENFQINWTELETKIKKVFGMDVFIGFDVDQNRYNALENLIYIGRVSRACPFRRAYAYNPEKPDPKWNEIVKHIMYEILHNVSEPILDDFLDEAITIINNMTIAVDKFRVPDNYTEENNYHMGYTFDELQDEIDIHLAEYANQSMPNFLQNYVGYMFEDMENATIDFEEDLVYIKQRQKPYLLHILSVLVDTSSVHIELYMWWSIVVCMIMNTSKAMVSFIEGQQLISDSDALKRGPNTMDLKTNCARDTTQYLGFVVAYGIAEKTFFTTSGFRVRRMVEEIRESFRERVEEIDWMDEETKKAALEKSKNTYSFIGLPDWIFKKNRLAEYYDWLKMNSTTFLSNKMQIIQQKMPNVLRKFNTKNGGNNRDFPMNPTIVNAFNMLRNNAIVIPLAILTFPLYHLGLEVLNYGTMGCILGHELTHGFDNYGRLHDEFGSFRNWWTNHSIRMFRVKSRCFVKQYDRITIKGVKGHVSGVRTLGENIADNGGVNHAFVAYKKFEKRSGYEPKLPGFENFTHDQMFFIALGSVWCQTITPDVIQQQMRVDPHSPGSIRVNTMASNSKDFAEAFNCPEGSKMNPTEKCKIW